MWLKQPSGKSKLNKQSEPLDILLIIKVLGEKTPKILGWHSNLSVTCMGTSEER